MKDPARTWNAVVVGEDTPCCREPDGGEAETAAALIGAVVIVLEDLRPALPTRRGLQIQRYRDVRLIPPQPSAMSTPPCRCCPSSRLALACGMAR